MNEPPSLFGMHNNSTIKVSLEESNTLCDQIMLLLPKDQGDQGVQPEVIISEKAVKMLEMLDIDLDYEEAVRKYPVNYMQSMNVVLHQEITRYLRNGRYQRLLVVIRNSLEQIISALEGRVNMTNESDIVYNAIFVNRLPSIWIDLSYPSQKPMNSYLIDLINRLNFL